MAAKEWIPCATCLPLPHPFHSLRYSCLPPPPPQSLLSYIPPLHDSFVFHRSSTTLSPSAPLLLSPPLVSYPQPLPVPERKMMRIVLELLVLVILVVVVGTGPGWLADLHQAQMTQAGVQRWGKQRGGTVGTAESVVVCEYLPQLWKNMAESIETILTFPKTSLLFKTCLFQAF